jgi:hypothetical protein
VYWGAEMAVGRISGPLLAQNLLRNGVDLAFETKLLYLDVTNGRIGVQQTSPQYELDVNGTINAQQILANTGTIGLMTFFSSTGSSTISTSLGPINIQPAALEKIYLNADTQVTGNLHATGDITADGNIYLGNSTGTDALFIDAEVKTDFIPYVNTGSIISNISIGSSSTYWKNGYFNNVVTNYLNAGTGTNITAFPNDTTSTWINGVPNNQFIINGDIRVYGGSPIGTAPVVSNVLYVTEDGNDGNDGRAEDSSRACRTITGAVNSPYYKQGTIIKVRSGSYYEDNPIQLLPYTAVIGDDLRTTYIYPKNNTLDLFWVNSGVYIAQMTFMNLRRGYGVTRYAPGGSGSYQTGAYCVAFPPNLTNPIDVYHSPYIQNCTNQSGPWLMDGTMFVPNNTVQIPRVWGTSTYIANTNTVLFYTSSTCIETVKLGDTINTKGFKVDPSLVGPFVTNISNPNVGYYRAQQLLQANKIFLQAEVVAYINTSFPTLSYSQLKYYRDVGLIMDAIAYDATLGGNVQSVTAGLAYWNGNTPVQTVAETSATVAALRYINTLCQYILSNTVVPQYYQTTIPQYINTNLYGADVATLAVTNCVSTITNIVSNWLGYQNAAALISSNISFIQTETVAYLNYAYPGYYDPNGVSYRDTGFVVNAIQSDLLRLSNVKSIEAGGNYWQNGVSILTNGDQTVCAAGLQYAKSLTKAVVQNTVYSPTYQSTVTQVINTSLTNGAVALNSIELNFNTITKIITSGTNYAPTSTNSTLTNFLITLSTTTIVGVTSATTVYFGDTSVYPVREPYVPQQWSTGGIADRSLDPHGSGGGALVDGNAPSSISPVQSFVFDAFTQVTQGGNGIHVMNSGYAQLVSVFTIFCDVAVHCESGGIASITNSNSNFGDQCLLSEGYGALEFSGTVYNPPNVAYDLNYNTWASNLYYPEGFFPYRQQLAVFVPSAVRRPHISLVMEVVPPDYYVNYNGITVPYVNSQGYPGFLAAIANTSSLTAGSYTITGIDTSGIAIGHTVNINDEYGYSGLNNGTGTQYISSGTTVTNITFGTITLSNPLPLTASQPFNDNYFNLYFSGNAYYSILSSTVAADPVAPGQNVLQGFEKSACTEAWKYLSTLTNYVITNTKFTATYQTSTVQTVNLNYTSNTDSVAFVQSEITTISTIVNQGPQSTPVIKNTGTVALGASAAVNLLNLNKKFLQTEVNAFLTTTYGTSTWNVLKSYRDIGLLVTALVKDLSSGGNFYACEAGNTFWSVDGTYHVVTVEEGVTDPTQFVDGSIVNFYQRSYMSASGYLFEYVGAGTDYGALPQVGKADPVQAKEVIQLNNGKVFFTSTDQNGDFRIGPGLVISQATGVLSGRTFQKSLFAEMTPFILAIEPDVGG